MSDLASDLKAKRDMALKRLEQVHRELDSLEREREELVAALGAAVPGRKHGRHPARTEQVLEVLRDGGPNTVKGLARAVWGAYSGSAGSACSEEEAAQLSQMTRKQRIDWAAEREALTSLHHSMHSGKTRNQRKAGRQNRGKRRGR